MGYSNINAAPNYQLQGFGQSGMRTISTSQAYVEGEYYRVLVATQDSTISATSVIGDDITDLQVYAGTTIYGLFTAVSVSVGEVTAYLAGVTDIESVWSYINTYGLNNGAIIEAADCAKDAIEPLLDKYYAQASLVLVPSLYKTSIVYAERPLDANGQLTFTRASEATRVGPDGYVEKVRTNLVFESETFDSGTWGKSLVTITANFDTAPNGTLTADRFVSAGGAFPQIAQTRTVVSGTQYTASIYVKSDGTAQIAQAILIGGASASFTPTTSWQRVTVTFTASAGTASFVLATNSATSPASSFVIWGAQLETGDIATNYIPTTTAAVSVGPVSNLPRLDYPINADGSVGCPSLLLEPQRTNVFPNSENTANWTLTNMTRTLNAGTSPDGYASADLLAATTTGAVIFTSDNTTITLTSGQPFVCSFFIKLGTSFTSNVGTDIIDLRIGGTAAWSARPTIRLNLATGAVTNIANASYLSSTNYGNGWYRITFGATPTASGVAVPLQIPSGTTMTEGGSFYIWGLQGENDVTYATSYIPTLATSVTRVADACSKTGISSLIGQTEGTLYWEGKYDYRNISGYRLLIGVSDGTWNNSGGLFIDNAAAQNQFAFYVRSGGITTVSILASNLTNSDVGKTYKVAAAYKQNDFVLYINGVQMGTDTSGAVFASASRIDLGSIGFTGLSTSDLSSASQALLFKTRLTNAQLSELTSL